MYKIIGGDQKEYGPVSAEDIRRWIAEGRANGQTQVLAEGATEWKPLSAFPEFAEALGTTLPGSAAAPVAGTRLMSPEELVARDYELDIGSCLTRSWELVKEHFWPVIGITLLVLVVLTGANQLLGLISGPPIQDMILHRRVTLSGILIVFGVSLLGAPVSGILMGGLYKYYLKLIRGERAGIGDAFSGFGSAIGRLALLGLLTSFLSMIAFLFCVVPSIYVSIAWVFGVPLVIDRDLGVWEAMELSRKLVSKHWFLVFACVLVIGLVSCCGIIGCCVGILATMPIGWVALMYAYEDIFSRRAP